MKNVGTVGAVGLTVLAIITIVVVSSWPDIKPRAEAMPEPEVMPAIVTPVAGPTRDTAAIEAAFLARETLMQTQIEELDRELADRQADYEARAAELAGLITTGEDRLALLDEQNVALKAQLDELVAAQGERQVLYDGQLQQAYSQYQISIQQLQLQLDTTNAKLAETLAQLGQ